MAKGVPVPLDHLSRGSDEVFRNGGIFTGEGVGLVELFADVTAAGGRGAEYADVVWGGRFEVDSRDELGGSEGDEGEAMAGRI